MIYCFAERQCIGVDQSLFIHVWNKPEVTLLPLFILSHVRTLSFACSHSLWHIYVSFPLHILHIFPSVFFLQHRCIVCPCSLEVFSSLLSSSCVRAVTRTRTHSIANARTLSRVSPRLLISIPSYIFPSSHSLEIACSRSRAYSCVLSHTCARALSRTRAHSLWRVSVSWALYSLDVF